MKEMQELLDALSLSHIRIEHEIREGSEPLGRPFAQIVHDGAWITIHFEEIE